MQPGDTYDVEFYVQNTAGAAVTGLLDSTNLTLTKLKDGATSSATEVFAEIGSGYYRYRVTTESTKGSYFFHVKAVAPTTHFVVGGVHKLEVEQYDIDAMYARVVVPRISQSLTSTPASDTTLTIDADRYHDVAVTIVDQTGAAIDLSGYTGWVFTVQDATHTSNANIPYSLISGISGDANGLLTFSIPETASFYNQIDSEITGSGVSSIELYYDVKADKGGVSGQTQNIMRGKIILRRYEGAA